MLRRALPLALLGCLLNLLLAHVAAPGTESGADFFAKAWPAVSLPHKRATLSAKLIERVWSVEATEGQRVKKGHVLIRLDSRLLAQQIAMAEHEADYKTRIKIQQAKCDHLVREFKKREELGGFVSESELNQARLQMQIARLQVDELLRTERLAKSKLEYYKTRMHDYAITSPIDGVVASLWVEAGEMVDEGSKVAEVIAPDVVEVRVHIFESNLAPASRAKKARVRFPAVSTKRTFPGHVHYLAPCVDSSSGTFLVKILVDASGTHIKPGLACEVQFVDQANAGP